ncbi:hypothetical protein H4C81_10495 [Pseudomonas monteilii]|uniref:hypothetical protein n=1 Tax=Pseudomonas monteilii TaxID=76759 RepID=UPI0006DA153C|nr:hypothetical protein [Pseudomonas monteilii]KPM58117.1 hypothetical protein HB4184_26035 [Pseudomonas putida]MBA6089322.1 hypothetical protein [Pseudomonas monteilii]
MTDDADQGLRARLKANYIADWATLPTELLPALQRLDDGPRSALVGLLASMARSPACQLSYDLGLVHGHIFAALQRKELTEAETEGLLAFVREVTL